MALSMKGKVCWNQKMLDRILDTDALQVFDHLFSATHHPVKMYRQMATSTQQGTGTVFEENQFLQEFLGQEDYIFVAILGESGVGKSHLIRWVHAQVPETPQRRVLLVPKGSSLKRVIELILQGMEGPKFDQYREKLKHSSAAFTMKQAREMLIDHIAFSISENGQHRMQDLKPMEKYFAEQLPALFRDPHFRLIFLEDGGIIDRLTDHIAGDSQDAERREERRTFKVEDLPMRASHIEKASAAAQDIFTFLLDDEAARDEAIEWINKNLDHAIAQMLSFNGSDLMELMKDVREELARLEIELVLLIEDFAVLQGIDFQLLDALLTKPRGDGDRLLCNLRVAMACTTGYFGTLPPTVQRRIEFRVDLDILEDEQLISAREIEKFVSRYLNALRVPESTIKTWHAEQIAEGSVREMPSACSGCKLAEQCHGAFGAVNGIGLYPFNQVAIRTMYERLPDSNKSRFNPRLMIKDVLKQTLKNYGQHIEQGNFPPPALLTTMGGRERKRLVPRVINELVRQDRTHADRREVMLELWSDTEMLIDLHPVIHEAFQLPVLRKQPFEKITDEPASLPEKDSIAVKPLDGEPAGEAVKNEAKPSGSVATTTNEEKLPPKVQMRIDALNDWEKGMALPQSVTQDLRDLLYPMINFRIDWDGAMLQGSWVRAAHWLKTSISFIGQTTETRSRTIQLRLPMQQEQERETVLALQGLVYFEHYKHWRFSNGLEYLRYVSRYLEMWSAEVLSQCQTLKLADGKKYDPVSRAVEVLALGAKMSGEFPAGADLVGQVNSLFMPMPQSSQYRSQQWNDLYNSLRDLQAEAVHLLAVHTASNKGGKLNYKFLDVTQVIAVLDTLREKGFLHHGINKSPSIQAFKKLDTMYQSLYATLHPAIDAESRHKLAWHKEMVAIAGEQPDLAGTSRDVIEAITKAEGEGMAVTGMETLQKQAESFTEISILEFWLQTAAGLERDLSVFDRLDALASLPVREMGEVEIFVKSADKLLNESIDKIKQTIGFVKPPGEFRSAAVLKQEIANTFEELLRLVKGMDEEVAE
ncbi:hypothetical protein EV586_105221 [Tumebacillus sp. BK434]|uniref:protein DpdH n=1 Tax=Tumebacillus sp. BK434 TaxID=2512169 RepID=UPI00104F16F3|nr:protein DpdH [Tumebacillus sp. BK434]TCP53875.1 hypothetical protein EV586_105221 [Tumebacillus sp. BK434]